MTDERRPRLNPFAFPSDTAFRFGLLVVAVLGANLYVWQWISTATRSAADDAAAALACLELAPGAAGSTAEFDAAQAAYSRCVNELYRYQVWWMLGGTAALLAVAALLVAAAPWWIRRRRRLVAFAEADAPAFAADVRSLAAEQGVAPPALYWNPADGSAAGIAFGRPGAYSIGFGGGLVVRHATEPAACRAVVRHELAHIRNRDVALTYGALAIALSFLLVSVLPFFATLLDEGGSVAFGLVWRIAALAGLVYVTLTALLRSREIYADVRASVHDTDGGLRRILASLPAQERGPLRRLRSVHPPPAARLAAVADTRRLFPLPALVAFGAGLTATIAFESVVQLFSTFSADTFDLRTAAALAFVPLAVGVVGVAIWREAFAALVDGRTPASPWTDALAFTGGLLLGPELALERTARGDATLLGGLDTTAGFLWLAALVAVVVLLLAWTRTSAWWWLAALGSRRPYVALATGLLTAAAGVTVFLGVYFGAHAVRESLAFSRAASASQHAFVDGEVWAVPRPVWQFVMDPELMVIVQKPYVVPALVLLAVFPLLAALVRRRDGDAGWAFLDPGGEVRSRPHDLHPLWPVAVGALAGVSFLALAALIRLSVHYGVDAATRATDAAILSIYVFTFAVALAVQLAAGAVAAWRGGLVASLGAVFVAGCFSWLAIVGGPFAGGCVDPLSINPGPCAWTVESSFALDVFQQVIAEGTIVGLAGGIAALGVRAALARRHAAEEELQPAVVP